MFSKFKKYQIIILSAVVFAVTLVLILIELDRQNYQVKKKEIIVNYWDEFFSLDQEKYNQYTLLVLKAEGYDEREKAKELLAGTFRKKLEGDNSIYRIALEDADYQIILEESEDKFSKYNTFRNSLFLKNFSGQTSLKISDPVDKSRLGRLIVAYTTPKNDQRIIDLTTRYRYYAIFIIVVLCLVYAYILKYLILPVKRVVGNIDEARGRPPVLFTRPKSLLEKEYNNLARDALLTRVSQKLKDFLATSANLERSRILSDLPEFICSLFQFDQLTFINLKRNESGGYEAAGIHEKSRKYAGQKPIDVQKYVLEHLTSPAIPFIEKNLKDRKHMIGTEATERFCYTDIVYADKDYNDMIVMAVVPRLDRPVSPSSWFLETWRLLSDEIRLGLKTIENQRKVIFREKSEATISLSRNLGHDLTNIIATSKLDLLAVKSFLDQDESRLAESPQRQQIFKESLAALLKNTMFLQQIVNVYRSFSFIKRPRFEFVDINQLLGEIVDLFRLSTSASVDIQTSFAAELPSCRVEERLVKLAVFNLLTNALDAIKRRSGTQTSGFIIVKTTYNELEDQVVISIRDSGDGIRNEEGELASAFEIDRIFSLGYSTKEHEEGEGLGLNWVYTIITEFHKGRIVPTNHPEGGAEFLIYLNRDIGEYADEDDDELSRES